MAGWIRRIVLWNLLAACIAGFAQAQDPLKIGLIVSLTGDYAYIGEMFRVGAELAREDLIREGKSVPVQIVLEDFGLIDKAKAVAAFHKLTTVDHVQIVLTQSTSEAPALVPLAKRDHMPLVVLWDINAVIEKMGAPVFPFGFSTEGAARDLAIFAYTRLGVRSVVVVGMQDSWSEIMMDEFVRVFTSLGGKVVAREILSSDGTEARSLVSKYRQSEGFFGPLYFTPLYSLVKALRGQAYEGKIILGDGLVAGDIPLLGSVLEGVYFSQVWVSDQAFIKRVQDRVKSQSLPMNVAFAALSYDAVKLLGEISQGMTSITPAALLSKLATAKYAGISGNIDYSKHPASDKHEALLTVRNGVIELAP